MSFFCHIIIWGVLVNLRLQILHTKTHRITTTRFEASSELRNTHGLEPFQEQLDDTVQKSGGGTHHFKVERGFIHLRF